MKSARIEQRGAHAVFVLERSFACSRTELWPWLTEPARMQRWSRARVTMRGPFVAGAERSVRLCLGALPVFVLRERITDAKPAQGFGYTGSSLRGHRGRVVLEHDGARTRLTWTAEFEAPLGLLATPMARYVCWQMQTGFQKLEALLGSATPP